MKIPTHISPHRAQPLSNALGRFMEHGRAAMHLATRTLVERQSSTSSSAVVCTGKEASQPICQKPEGGSSSGTLAIALGAAYVLPLSRILTHQDTNPTQYSPLVRSYCADFPAPSTQTATTH